MKRSTFIKTTSLLASVVPIMKASALFQAARSWPDTPPQPALFVGHGNPMNAIEDNIFSRGMKQIGQSLPKPRSILVVSAHWETKGTFITGQDLPPTIHDFRGFPQALFDVEYPASGDSSLSNQIREAIPSAEIHLDYSWGFDHGCWSVLKNLFPEADVPVIQLSLDYTMSPAEHYALARELRYLRTKGVLIIGSGNVVHNFSQFALNGNGADFNQEFAHDWAKEANELFHQWIDRNDVSALVNYTAAGRAVRLAVPTPEHYLPLLYTLGVRGEQDQVSFFNDAIVAGAFSMTSVKLA